MTNLKISVVALLLIVLAGAPGLAQSQSAEKPGTEASPVTFLPDHYDLSASGLKTMELDPDTLFPPGGPPYSLFSPFAVYARPVASLSTGRGALADVLRTGVGSDVGIRSLAYDDDRTAAWYGDVGLGYIYNNTSDSSVNLITRNDPITVSRFGTLMQVDGVTILGVRALHRIHARLALGREYYMQTDWFNGMGYSIGGDVGGLWGQAVIKTTVNDLQLIGGQPGDIPIYNPKNGHSSGVTKGFFLGTNFNLIFPRRTHDFIIGSRLEWQREYFGRLVDNNDGASQIKLMLEVGWRY